MRLALIALLAVALPAVAAGPPDVLFIVLDDLNDWVGALGGHPQAKTPNIDRLAARGMLFANAHTAAPSCNPSRAALLTGVRPSTSGVYSNLDDWRAEETLKGLPTLPKFFRDHGYHTAAGGKIFHAHTYYPEGFIGQPQPEAWEVRFPSFERQLADELRPPSWPINNNPDIIFSLFDWSSVEGGWSATGDGKMILWAERQLQEDRGDKPRLLAAGIYRPHLPWYVPQEYFEMHPLDEIELPATIADDLDDVPPVAWRGLEHDIHRWTLDHGYWPAAVQGYLASVSFADAMVGRLIAALDASGKADQTIIVLFSDHGFHLGEKGHWRKFSLWEESTHVPLIIVAPGVTQPGGRSEKPVSLLDIYPTLVRLAGLDPPAHLEGHSLLPLIEDPDAEWDHTAVTTWHRNNHAVRDERYRYILRADGSEELYDHADDPHEWRNIALAESSAAIKQRLARYLPAVNVE